MLGNWLRENTSVYLGNASAKRDLRAQLRGNRATLLWSAYLIALTVYAFLMYRTVGDQSYEATHNGQVMSVTEIQANLGRYYSQIIWFLVGVVSLVAPVLTASSLSVERQRQALDLIFSAPVSPKYYLVGKLLSSYRYTWMLLVLSLPFTSVCVMMGGASYGDVLVTYLLLSLHALALTALGLIAATMISKPVGAIIASYVLAGGYLFGGACLASLDRGYGLRLGGEAPFTSQLSPFFVPQTVSTYSVIAGATIPNWILTSIIVLAMVKLMLLGAGSALRPGGSKETTGLRVYTVVCFSIAVGFAARILGWAPYSQPTDRIGSWLCLVLLPLFVFIPQICCYGRDREQVYRDREWFSLSKTFSASPSGGLPYVLALLVCGIGAFALGSAPLFQARVSRYGDEITSIEPVNSLLLLPYALYLLSFFVAAWSFARLLSCWNRELARTKFLFFAISVPLLAIPAILIGADASYHWTTDPGESLWRVHPLGALSGFDGWSVVALCWTPVFLAIAALCLLVERRRLNKTGD